MKNFYHRTWAEIDLDVLKKNIDIIRSYAGDKDIIAIVKANAYGHGDAETAKAEQLRSKALRGFQPLGSAEPFLSKS